MGLRERPFRKAPRTSNKLERQNFVSSLVDRQETIIQSNRQQRHPGAVRVTAEGSIVALRLTQFSNCAGIPFLPCIVVPLEKRLRHVIAEVLDITACVAVLE